MFNQFQKSVTWAENLIIDMRKITQIKNSELESALIAGK
jgi:hypothetical protein